MLTGHVSKFLPVLTLTTLHLVEIQQQHVSILLLCSIDRSSYTLTITSFTLGLSSINIWFLSCIHDPVFHISIQHNTIQTILMVSPSIDDGFLHTWNFATIPIYILTSFWSSMVRYPTSENFPMLTNASSVIASTKSTVLASSLTCCSNLSTSVAGTICPVGAWSLSNLTLIRMNEFPT